MSVSADEPSPSHGSSVSPYRPDVDGLRAIAALSVVLAHGGWLPTGAFGVDVIFVISGFLISGIILRELDKNTFSIADFYARRVNRIFPALMTLMLVVGLLGLVMLPSAERMKLGENIAVGAAFSINFWIYAANFSELVKLSQHLLTHLWTLGIEEQFYLLWPLTLWIASRRKISVLTTILAATGISFISYVWMMSLNPSAAFFLPWNRLWELALGGLLACIQPSRLLAPAPNSGLLPENVQASAVLRPHSRRHLEMIGTACLLVSLGGLLPLPSVGWYQATSAVGSLLLIAAGPQGWISRHILSMRSLVLVGLFSYPLYLWHAPLFVFADILYIGDSWSDRYHAPIQVRIGVVVLSIFLSYFTYKYLERPIRSFKHSRKLAGILCVVMAFSAGAAYLFLA